MALSDFISASGVTLQAKVKAYQITIGAITGTFQVGEVITGGTSSATGNLIFIDSTANEMFLSSVVGTFAAAETLTGGTSGATTTVTSVQGANNVSNYITVSNLVDNITVNDSRQTTTIATFASDPTAFQDQIASGRTGTLSGNAIIVPTDDGFAVLDGGYRSNVPMGVKITRSSRGGTTYPAEEFQGDLGDFTRTYNQAGVAQAAFTFNISALGNLT